MRDDAWADGHQELALANTPLHYSLAHVALDHYPNVDVLWLVIRLSLVGPQPVASVKSKSWKSGHKEHPGILLIRVVVQKTGGRNGTTAME